MSMSTVCAKFLQLKPLFEYVFCVPASSAKKLCMMTSLCHGTLASALALQGVALAWPWECSDGLGLGLGLACSGLGLGLGLGVCGLVNIPG